MQIFHLTSYVLMFVLCSQLNSAMVVVRYSRDPVNKTEGLSLSLKCTVEYRRKDCDIDAKWLYANSGDLLPIVDNNRYLITVNETKLGPDKHRERNIFLKISSLEIQDSGFYQCIAKCLKTGTEGKGHIVVANITADPYKGLKVSAWSGQLKADTAALTFSAILLLLRCY